MIGIVHNQAVKLLERPAVPVRGVAAIGPAIRPQVRTFVRHGLILYFLLVIFEGVFRKWITPGLNQYVYLAKDTVLVFICARVVLSLNYIPIPVALRRTNVGQLFAAFAIFSFVAGFNPLLPNTLLGIWGIRTYVLPMSLVLLIPIGMPDPMENEKYFRWYMLLGIPVALLCMAQYRLPATHWLNQYSNTTEAGESVATVMDAVRVSGTFSYISGMTTYAAFQAAGLLGILFATRWRYDGNKLVWLNLLLTVGIIPMTGSRSVVLYFALYVLIVIALAPLVKQGAGSSSRLLLAGICAAALGIGFFGEAFDRLAERALVSGDTSDRFENLVMKPVEFLGDSGLFGFGAAATHQAAPQLVPGGESYYWLPTRSFEDEAGRVMLELGGVGFLIYIALKLAICGAVFKYIVHYGQRVPLAIPVACLLTVTSGMITGMLFSSVGSSFYWGLFGLFLSQANATVPLTPHAKAKPSTPRVALGW